MKFILNILVTIYYLPNLCDYQLTVQNILTKCEYDDNGKIISDYKKKIKDEIQDQTTLIKAFQYGAYVVKEVERVGHEVLKHDLEFSEQTILEENMNLIKLVTKASNIKIVAYNEDDKPKQLKISPMPGKPVFYCE